MGIQTRASALQGLYPIPSVFCLSPFTFRVSPIYRLPSHPLTFLIFVLRHAALWSPMGEHTGSPLQVYALRLLGFCGSPAPLSLNSPYCLLLSPYCSDPIFLLRSFRCSPILPASGYLSLRDFSSDRLRIARIGLLIAGL